MDLEEVKKLVANDVSRIELHDRISTKLRKILEAFESEEFSSKTDFSYEEFETRIEKCEELVKELCQVQALLGCWGSEKQSNNFTFPIIGLSNVFKGTKENRVWKAVKWHSVRLLFYNGGITTLAASNYQKLYQLFKLRIADPNQTNKKVSICESLVAVNSQMDSLYNKLIEKPNHKTPLSEYLFHHIKSIMSEVIYFGHRFESLFDRFEILYALDYINRQYDDIPEKVWAPIGRFGFKQYGNNPFHEMTEQAELQQENWPPLKAGFFRGNYSRFQQICTLFQEKLQRFRY